MSHADQLQRFIFEHSDIRGEILTLEESFQQVLSNAKYPAPIQALLGQFMAAAGLLSATLKFDGVLTLQAQGTGPLSTIMADCTRHHHLRAIAHFDEDFNYAPGQHLQELIGTGTLSLTINPNRGERYQGIVPLESDTLAGCLENYFAQSEQLATRIWLSAAPEMDSPRAAGLLLQALPNQKEADPEANQQLWEHATQLAATITPEEQLLLEHEQQLYRLFHQDELRIFEANPVQFSCSCSEDRISSALVSLGQKELQGILDEQGSIDIHCEFCHQHYAFHQGDIDDLFDESPPVLH
ncbi:Hsp33 family molecular chaperone HslO [Porticoccus sp.]